MLIRRTLTQERWKPDTSGSNLHRDQFTCRVRGENGRNYPSQWKREQSAQFLKKLRRKDEVAVESRPIRIILLRFGEGRESPASHGWEANPHGSPLWLVSIPIFTGVPSNPMFLAGCNRGE